MRLIMTDIIKAMLIPEDLEDALKKEILKLWIAKAPIEEATQKGVKISIEYWEKKNADKRGERGSNA
jgi:hypothetical protein